MQHRPERFLEQGVSALDTDTLSPNRSEDGFKVHRTYLSAGKIIIVNVANIDNMPQTVKFIMVLPIKIKESTEALVSLFGLIERE